MDIEMLIIFLQVPLKKIVLFGLCGGKGKILCLKLLIYAIVVCVNMQVIMMFV